MMKCRMKGNLKMMINREELKEVCYEPALKLVEELEKRQEILNGEEIKMLAKLKISLAGYLKSKERQAL